MFLHCHAGTAASGCGGGMNTGLPNMTTDKITRSSNGQQTERERALGLQVAPRSPRVFVVGRDFCAGGGSGGPEAQCTSWAESETLLKQLELVEQGT